MKLIALLPLSALLVVLAFACSSDERVVITVMAARIGGILTEEDGCLRITGSDSDSGTAIVWQKDALEVERRGDTFQIIKGDQSVTWRLGDEIVGGGGGIRARIADEHAGAGFSERCPGPYWLLGMVRDPVE